MSVEGPCGPALILGRGGDRPPADLFRLIGESFAALPDVELGRFLLGQEDSLGRLSAAESLFFVGFKDCDSAAKCRQDIVAIGEVPHLFNRIG